MAYKGSKQQRQNQHVRRLEKKIKKFEKLGKNTDGLKKEFGYMAGEERPQFRTGKEADPKFRQRNRD